MELDEPDRQNFLQDDIKERTQYRSMDRPHAADKGDEHCVECPCGRESMLGIITDVVIGESTAGEPDQSCRDDQRQQFMAERPNS